MRKKKSLNYFKILLGLCGVILAIPSADASEPPRLQGIWDAASGSGRPLRSWTVNELAELSPSVSREKDPQTGQFVSWKGILLSKWIEKELGELPLEQRSQVDLLVFKNEKGEQAVIPRYVAKAFPLMLAWERDRKNLSEAGAGFSIVVPWTSHSKIHRENLPWVAYQISGVREIHLTSYQSRFNALLLKRRRDPAAIRGEKLMVENCVSCHGSGRAKGLSEFTVQMTDLSQQVSFGHRVGVGFPQLSARDLRAFTSYLHEYRQENSSSKPPEKADLLKTSSNEAQAKQ